MIRLSSWPDDRFSVLSPGALRQIHHTFTADELLYVDLVFQYPGSRHDWIRSGRLLNGPDLQELETVTACDAGLHHVQVPQSTIECTCGYLVNMVDSSIRLISPCSASAEWPRGYIVHSGGTFHDAGSFRQFVEMSIDTVMKEHLHAGDRLAFRGDLVYESHSDGFTLTSRYRRHIVRGDTHVALLGRLIRDAEHTTADVTDRLIVDGMPILEAIALQDRMYQHGLLSES